MATTKSTSPNCVYAGELVCKYILTNQRALFCPSGALLTNQRALFCPSGALLTNQRALFCPSGALLTNQRALFCPSASQHCDKTTKRNKEGKNKVETKRTGNKMRGKDNETE